MADFEAEMARFEAELAGGQGPPGPPQMNAGPPVSQLPLFLFMLESVNKLWVRTQNTSGWL